MTHSRAHQNLLAPRRRRSRPGKVLVLFAILLPSLMVFIGLVIDGSRLLTVYRDAQHVVDAAATAAARVKFADEPDSAATAAALACVQQHNSLSGAEVTVNIPPAAGAYAGNPDFVEVIVDQEVPTYLLPGSVLERVQPRAVAGFEDTTAGAALVVLDPDPPPLVIGPLPGLLPPLPALIGGLELVGAGRLDIDGAVLVNTEWGGVDQNSDPAGAAAPLPFAVTTNAGLPLQKVRARNIRVVGGVDDPQNYENFDPAGDHPLEAGKLPVPDPFRSLPVPTLAADPANVSDNEFGGVSVVGIPLIGPPTQLDPGVYDWIEVISGDVVFAPGVYIVRSVHPLTNIALNLIGGNVTADGVMFYITNSPGYTPAGGLPDASDGETSPAAPGLGGLVPSAVINAGLTSVFRPLSDPGSPFDGMILYQRRQDRRPLVVVDQDLLGGGSFNGLVYAKWGHLSLVGQGNYDAGFVVGSLRIINALNSQIAPTRLLPPARDVFLVE